MLDARAKWVDIIPTARQPFRVRWFKQAVGALQQLKQLPYRVYVTKPRRKYTVVLVHCASGLRRPLRYEILEPSLGQCLRDMLSKAATRCRHIVIPADLERHSSDRIDCMYQPTRNGPFPECIIRLLRVRIGHGKHLSVCWLC